VDWHDVLVRQPNQNRASSRLQRGTFPAGSSANSF
jgi:hypothetical protein